MSNEDKILEMLGQIKDDISGIRADQESAKVDIAGIKTRLDVEVRHRFDLLAEGQQAILEKLERLDDMEVVDTRITALEAMVKKLNREMEKLKKAQ
nr:MAG TPA: hypothetical protein [Caudoviricetes sp.]